LTGALQPSPLSVPLADRRHTFGSYVSLLNCPVNIVRVVVGASQHDSGKPSAFHACPPMRSTIENSRLYPVSNAFFQVLLDRLLNCDARAAGMSRACSTASAATNGLMSRWSVQVSTRSPGLPPCGVSGGLYGIETCGAGLHRSLRGARLRATAGAFRARSVRDCFSDPSSRQRSMTTPSSRPIRRRAYTARATDKVADDIGITICPSNVLTTGLIHAALCGGLCRPATQW
jgi:hypothetical protein